MGSGVCFQTRVHLQRPLLPHGRQIEPHKRWTLHKLLCSRFSTSELVTTKRFSASLVETPQIRRLRCKLPVLHVGEDHTPSVTVDAQLTHPISRDGDSQAPDAPSVRAISTPRHSSGGRCRKSLLSTEEATVKRKCASCGMCGKQFVECVQEPGLALSVCSLGRQHPRGEGGGGGGGVWPSH